MFSLDDAYVVPFRVLWRSLLATDSVPRDTVVYVLHDGGLSNSSRESLTHIVTQSGWDVEFCEVPVSPEGFFPLDDADHVSLATYHRLFVHELLPSSAKSVVYLDLDTFAVSSIRFLFEVELSSPIAAVDHASSDNAYRLWGSTLGNYFQAGVLVIDLEAWRSIGASQIFARVLSDYPEKIMWWDQDVLNLAWRDDWQRLPIWFNVNPSLRSVLDPVSLKENAKLFHYSGTGKPWNTNPSKVEWSIYWLIGYAQEFGVDYALRIEQRKSVGPLTAGFQRAGVALAKSILGRGLMKLKNSCPPWARKV